MAPPPPPSACRTGRTVYHTSGTAGFSVIRSLQIDKPGLCRFVSRPPAPVGPGMARLGVRHVGLCGSDLNTFRGLNPLVSLPRTPGHEIGAVVMAVGPGVDAGLIGAEVTVLPYTSCGTCSSCRKGKVNACRTNQTLGVQQEGGLAEELVLPAEKLMVNPGLPARHLALIEPLSVGFHAIERGKVAAGDVVAVIGCGMIGMGAIVAAVARGARVMAIDPSLPKRAVALKLGARLALDPAAGDVVARIMAETGGDGVDLAVEAVGLPATFTQAIDLACFGGRVVYIGYSKQDVTYDTKLFNLKELDIMGSRNALIGDFHAAAAFLGRIGSDADLLISRVFPFALADQALPYWDGDRDALKIMIAV